MFCTLKQSLAPNLVAELECLARKTTWTRSYKANFSIEFDSTQELIIQISLMTNVSFSNLLIPA